MSLISRFTGDPTVEILPANRGGKISPARWASPIGPKLGPGWAIKFLARKKSGQIWPGPARPARIFFTLKRLFGPTGPVFRAGWAVKILARKNRAIFGLARFWPGPARPGPPDCHLYRPIRKAALRGKAYMWTPVLGSFVKIREVWDLSYLGFTLYLSVL